ncbi:MAG TPA: phytanoyl-CoA dioxygenase family protein [Anaeromyxobacter sp.]|nr:phytanoyl-CoA dioxygenase family protein [Anaeromyxobacter sp.]HVP59402.1 phytanoyl-CoA dioxygenase family protein [Myxococcaceae bacterium]
MSETATLAAQPSPPSALHGYAERGFAVVPDVLTPAEVAEIRREAVGIFRGERGAVEGIVPIDAGASEAETLRRYNAIHFPHKLSPLIRGYMAHPRVTTVLERLVSPNVKCMQSMLFVKGPGKPGQSWHQDEYYIPTRDRSLTGAWIALEDATVENGCLWVVPGSHREGFIRRRTRYAGQEYADVDTCDLAPFTERDQAPVPVAAGGAVFFNGYLLHSSLRNRSRDSFRMALVFHYMSAESMLPWDNDGRLPATEDLRDVVLVAGADPYAYKGLVSVTRPFLRGDEMRHKVSPDAL